MTSESLHRGVSKLSLNGVAVTSTMAPSISFQTCGVQNDGLANEQTVEIRSCFRVQLAEHVCMKHTIVTGGYTTYERAFDAASKIVGTKRKESWRGRVRIKYRKTAGTFEVQVPVCDLVERAR